MSVVEENLRYSVSARSFLRFGSPLGITVQVNIDVPYAKLLHFILGPHAKGAARYREYNDSSFHVRWKREDRVKRKFAAVTLSPSLSFRPPPKYSCDRLCCDTWLSHGVWLIAQEPQVRDTVRRLTILCLGALPAVQRTKECSVFLFLSLFSPFSLASDSRWLD